MATADLLLHPVRLRMSEGVPRRPGADDRAAGRRARRCAAPGSLYRHIAILTKAGVLQVVAERRTRGAVERTYTLRLLAARIAAGRSSGDEPRRARSGLHGLHRGPAGRLRPVHSHRAGRPGQGRRETTGWPPCGSPMPSSGTSCAIWASSRCPGWPTRRARAGGGG